MNKSNYKQFPVTFGLIAGCVIVYIYTSLRYSFDMNAWEGVEAGGYLPAAIYFDHEYSRLITANFIHFGLLHIVMNMLSLLNIGPFMETMFGFYRYLILIIGSALGTTILPYIYYLLFLDPLSNAGLTVSGGASGIILGLLGGLCFLSLRYRGVYQRVFRSIVPSLLLVVFMSITVPSVSLSGHLGGFFGGFLTTMVISKINPHPTWNSISYFSKDDYLN